MLPSSEDYTIKVSEREAHILINALRSFYKKQVMMHQVKGFLPHPKANKIWKDVTKAHVLQIQTLAKNLRKQMPEILTRDLDEDAWENETIE